MIYLSQSYVYLTIYGNNFSPDEFTQLVEINPTDFGLKGEKRKTGATLKESFWKYQLNDTDALESLESSLTELANLFRVKVRTIRDYIQSNGLCIKCNIVIMSKNNENNGVALNLAFISFLTELNATVEIDIYST